MKYALSYAVLLIGVGCGSSTRTSEGPHDGPGAEAGEGGTAGTPAGGNSGSDARGGGSGANAAGRAATAGSGGVAGGAVTTGGAGASGAPDAAGGTGAAGGGDEAGGAGGAAGDPDLPHRACATSAHEPEETCSGVEAQPLANPTSVADEMYNLVLESEWTALWGVVGQYACGDAPVYRGSFSADTTDGEADWPDAIASLVMGEGIDWIATSRQGPHLTVFDPVSGRKTRLVQQVLGTTETSIIAEQNSSFGVGASCTDCFVDLETRPERIEFDYVANGEYGDGSPLMISASGWFEQIRPGEVTFSDIQTVTNVYSSAIQDIRQSFETCGAELIRRSAGEYRIPAPAPAGSGFRDNQCARAVFFSATWHLDADRPAAHGIRALTIDEPRYCCQDLNGETGPVRSECYDP